MKVDIDWLFAAFLSFTIVYGFDDILVEKDKKAAQNQSISTCIYIRTKYIFQSIKNL